MKTNTGALVLATAMLVACGTAGARPPGVDETVFIRTASGLQALSAATGKRSLNFPGGVTSYDFSTFVSTRATGASTAVSRSTADGELTARSRVPGRLEARVVSGSGNLVALTAARKPGSSPYLPGGKERTRIVVVDVKGRQRTYSLKGNFEPEAFSVDESELFTIEYIPALEPKRYQVRRLVLENGKVKPIGRLKGFAPEQMQGTGRTQVHSLDGSELYTLYTQQRVAGHEGPSIGGDHAFVHLLSLKDSWAHCIDLPHGFGAGDATASALAVAPDGMLYVADWTNGALAVVKPKRLRVVDSIEINFGSPDGETFAQVSERRIFVGGKSEIVVLGRNGLDEQDRWSVDGEIAGMDLSPDGKRLYVAADGRVVALSAATGRLVGTIITGATGTIEGVAR